MVLPALCENLCDRSFWTEILMFYFINKNAHMLVRMRFMIAEQRHEKYIDKPRTAAC